MANTQIIDVLEQIEFYLNKLGEPFRAKAYKTASTAIAQYPEKITTESQLKSIKGVGDSSIKHIMEFLNTGKTSYIDKLKNKPEILFTTIYGIGPKKAQELTKSNIKSIEDLKNAYMQDPSILNDKQTLGLKYYHDIEQRIPRDEIEQFDKIMNSTITSETNLQYQIVGSYRRGASNSGDIDVILSTTNKSITSKQQTQLFHKFLKYLEAQNIITHTLAIGNTKSLVIGKIPGSKFYRRIDFLYTTPEQFPFAILYFTGSKDAVFKNENGGYDIYDWKRSKEIKRGGFNNLQHPVLSALPDSNYWLYSLQLNLYKYVLEKNYGLRIDNLFLVAIHPEFKTFQKHQAPNLRNELLELFKHENMLE